MFGIPSACLLGTTAAWLANFVVPMLSDACGVAVAAAGARARACRQRARIVVRARLQPPGLLQAAVCVSGERQRRQFPSEHVLAQRQMRKCRQAAEFRRHGSAELVRE